MSRQRSATLDLTLSGRRWFVIVFGASVLLLAVT
jgi:hypothetical protein